MPGSGWGETRFLNEQEWGTKGTRLTGANIRTTGTRIDGNYGMVWSHTNLSSFVPGAYYSMTWYQPTYKTTYAADQLRRYNAGANDGDKVQAYCFGLRSLTHNVGDKDILAANAAGSSGVVTLTGASALFASAIALGTAALAF